MWVRRRATMVKRGPFVVLGASRDNPFPRPSSRVRKPNSVFLCPHGRSPHGLAELPRGVAGSWPIPGPRRGPGPCKIIYKCNVCIFGELTSPSYFLPLPAPSRPLDLAALGVFRKNHDGPVFALESHFPTGVIFGRCPDPDHAGRWSPAQTPGPLFGEPVRGRFQRVCLWKLPVPSRSYSDRCQ